MKTASLTDILLERARARYRRLTSEEAASAQARGALLVDIRSVEHRARNGQIPGAISIERTVLEWRLDPTSPWRIPEATSQDIEVVLICAEGYSSSLAAASLRDLGLSNVTDVIDGFVAWRSAGLPVEALEP
jgi:rhodanese-related sulfurtransferase